MKLTVSPHNDLVEMEKCTIDIMPDNRIDHIISLVSLIHN